jgi:predicted nucleic acid-binding protein
MRELDSRQSNAPVLPDLDEGEAASIRLALALGGETLLLIDERAGRSVSQEFGLQLAGTAAVIQTWLGSKDWAAMLPRSS